MNSVAKNTYKQGFLKRKPRDYTLKSTLSCYLMLSTQIIGFLVLTAYPILWAASKAWFNYTGVPSQTRFVAWDNFIQIFTKDATYWQSWLTTLKFALLKLPLELPLAILIAVLLNQKLKGSGLFRALFYLPNVISVAIVGLVFGNMFGYFGVINALLMKLGVISAGINWLENTHTAMIMLMLASTWSTFGVNMIYFLGALQTIPEELYESAKLDGAGRFTVFFRITLPMIAPVLQTILLLAINGTLHINEMVLVSTNGAPGGTTLSVMAYIVRNFVPGFAESTDVNIGYGCAMALITSVIFCFIAMLYSKLSKKLSEIY